MSVTFSSRPYRVQTWSTAQELAGFLSRCDAGSVLLDSGTTTPAQLYSVTLYLDNPYQERFGIGVLTDGETGMPHLLLKPQLGLVLVGVDRLVRGVDVQGRSLSFSLTCDAPFSQFIEVADAGVVLVFHRTGVIAIAEDGWELWRRDVGRILDWACEEGTLYLRLEGAPTARLNVRSGDLV
jgi:hypothetical protein